MWMNWQDNDQQDAQLSQKDHAAGSIRFGQKWKTGGNYLQPL